MKLYFGRKVNVKQGEHNPRTTSQPRPTPQRWMIKEEEEGEEEEQENQVHGFSLPVEAEWLNL